MTALSDSEIIAARDDGTIIIEPFNVNNLGNCSYDVRLGEWFYRESFSRPSIFNIYDEVQVNRVWGSAIRAPELQSYYIEPLINIEPNDRVIMIVPGETILAHTDEFIGSCVNKTQMMKARSSFGRVLIEVCKDAGWGDIGYVNRWTMEITNNSRYYTIPLVVGRRIAQIVFIRVGSDATSYVEKGGKYQSSESIEELRAKWKPEDMLPKLYIDKDIET